MEIGTWYPERTIRSEMRTFFIGGSDEISDLSYLGFPSERNPKVTSPAAQLIVRTEQ